MIADDVCIQASLDEPTQSVVMHRTEPSRLQSLALQLAEKMASLVDQNERSLEVKTTGLGYFNYQRPGFCHTHIFSSTHVNFFLNLAVRTTTIASILIALCWPGAVPPYLLTSPPSTLSFSIF